MKKHFITFTNSSYMTSNRIARQVSEFGVFDEIRQYNEADISGFIMTHRNFILQNTPGYGRWIWKPKIIYDTLNDISDGEFVMYCDAGTFMNIKGKTRLLEYFDLLADKEMIVFATSKHYRAKDYCIIDAIMEYNPEFITLDPVAVYAGVMIIKKTSKTVQLVLDWLHMCENYNYLTGRTSGRYRNISTYCGNDGDNGLFNLCISKYRDIVCSIFPDECNIYTPSGIQMIHTGVSAKHIDWSSLDRMPIQIRRITPKFYSKEESN